MRFSDLDDDISASSGFWERSWNYLYKDVFKENDYNIIVYGSLVYSTGLFWLFNAALTVICATGRPKFIIKYKIQENDPIPVERRKLKKAILTILFNQLVLSPPLAHLTFYLSQWRGNPVSAQQLPTLQRMLAEIAVCAVMEEIMFYYSHRLLHHPLIYKYIHKVHHEWTAPISIISAYAHPVEYVISLAFPPYLCSFIVGSHLSTTWVWYALTIMSASMSHCGFHLPFMPSPEAHEFHHEKFTNCFGFMGVLDYLHGTDKAFRASKSYQRHFTLMGLVPVKDVVPLQSKKQKEMDEQKKMD